MVHLVFPALTHSVSHQQWIPYDESGGTNYFSLLHYTLCRLEHSHIFHCVCGSQPFLITKQRPDISMLEGNTVPKRLNLKGTIFHLKCPIYQESVVLLC